MTDFCAQVKAELAAGDYAMAPVDLRYNGGGSDGVIFPLLTVLAEERRTNGLKIFCLTDEITYSSAVINAFMMKDMGAIIVGAPTGGSVDHFGSTTRFNLPNSGHRITVSTKMIEMREYLENRRGSESGASPFTDLYPFGLHTQAIEWAYSAGIQRGRQIKAP